MCTREDALKTIVFDRMGYGKIENLLNKIGMDLFMEFSNLGYVHEIRPSSFHEEPTFWIRTKIADDDYRFYDPDFDSQNRAPMPPHVLKFTTCRSKARISQQAKIQSKTKNKGFSPFRLLQDKQFG